MLDALSETGKKTVEKTSFERPARGGDARGARLLVDCLARVPLRERRRREHELLDGPLVAHVVLAEAEQRDAAVGPDVAGHRRLDAVGAQRRVHVAQLLLALAREQ
eukprot:5726147-Prymnesium_polylepis.1